ncbi:unnamed protein product [Urochloa humidicola]
MAAGPRAQWTSGQQQEWRTVPTTARATRWRGAPIDDAQEWRPGQFLALQVLLVFWNFCYLASGIKQQAVSGAVIFGAAGPTGVEEQMVQAA